MQDQNPESTEPQTTPAEAPADTATETAAEATPDPRPKTTRRAKAKPERKTATRRRVLGKTPKKSAKPAIATSAKRKRVSRFVVLFRHGLAEEHSVEKPDSDRSLTAEGHAKTRSAARGLEELLPEADALFSSPLLRAMQTALWLTKAYKDKLKVQVTDALLPFADPARLAELIASQEGRNVIVVGHEPHLTNAFAHFVGRSGSIRAELKKAGCIGIQLDENGRGVLEWMLAPRMLRKLG